MPCFRFLSIFLVSSISYAQLHIITGRATPEAAYTAAANLVRVNDDGTLATVQELASEKEGMWWIDAADDARISAMLTADPKFKIIVIDMDQGKVVKRCDSWPIADPDASHTETWLVGEGNGNVIIGRYLSHGGPDSVAQGAVLDPRVACDASFRVLSPADVRSIYMQGSGGAGGATGIEGPMLLFDADGAVRTRIGPDRVYFGYTVPREYRQGMKVPLGHVWANNSKVLVVSYWDRENEARARAGFLGLERSMDLLFPGRLHVYDVATGKRSVIVTNEEDSEVLLVHEDTIYYRVKDSLYSAKLGASGFMPGQKIATDDRILDAHWAFMK